MKSERLEKFIGKKVKVTFHDNDFQEGFLGHGDYCFGKDGWQGKGYHLIYFNNPYLHSVGFKKSHVKKIEEIP